MIAFEEAEQHVLFGICYRATDSEANRIYVAVMDTPEWLEFSMLDWLLSDVLRVTDPRDIQAQRLCRRRAELWRILSLMTMREVDLLVRE